MVAAVELDRVTIRYGDFTAARDINLKIAAGEFFSFLGPSGCGKTTLLRAISGFVEPTEGHVLIGGREMTGVGPNKRPTALIFQNLALFPTMSVAENVGYGLRVRGVSGRERKRRVQELLDLIALPDKGASRVDELSGGQRQRVAIARALAVEPQVLLLDEPLSALDLKLRQHMRNELRAIQRRVGLTFIYITHDQGEALTMSDRIAVMNRGRIEQVGDARTVYAEPRTAFVAAFVGETNALPGRITAAADGLATIGSALGSLTGRNPLGLAVGDEASIFVRPEAIVVGADAATPGRNAVQGRLVESAFEGQVTHLAFAAPDGTVVRAVVGLNDTRPIPSGGESVTLCFTDRDAIVLPPGAP